MTIHELWNSITFLIFKMSLAISFPPASVIMTHYVRKSICNSLLKASKRTMSMVAESWHMIFLFPFFVYFTLFYFLVFTFFYFSFFFIFPLFLLCLFSNFSESIFVPLFFKILFRFLKWRPTFSRAVQFYVLTFMFYVWIVLTFALLWRNQLNYIF